MKRTALTIFTAALAVSMFTAPVPANAAFILGDTNNDTCIDAVDASAVLIEYSTVQTQGIQASVLDSEQRKAADVNSDGAVDSIDASWILSYYSYTSTGGTSSLEQYMLEVEYAGSILGTLYAYASRKDNITEISWNSLYGVSGYEVYRSSEGIDSGYNLIKDISGSSSCSYTETASGNVFYYYKVRPYILINGNKVFGNFSSPACSICSDAVLNGKKGIPHSNIVMYNVQQKNTTSETYYLSGEDIKTLKKFADEHFKPGMTDEDKMRVTMEWIHYNVEYADIEHGWYEISGLSWVDAVFNHKKGQCIQYNGAMAAMLAYLGYDASMIQGWRGD